MSSSPSKKHEKERLRFSLTAFRNDQLHFHLDDAKGFSDNVTKHLLKAKQPNHVLSTATKSYDNFKIRRMTKSQSHLPEYKNAQSQATSRIILKNPESQPLISALDSKARRVVQIGNIFYDSTNQKQQLQHRISQLKRLILSQTKQKDKVNLNNCRMVNEMQRLKANIRRYGEESKNDDILIRQVLNDCLDLQNQLNRINADNRNCQQNIDEHRRIVDELHDKVLELKRFLSVETRQMHSLKQKQTIAFKLMVNDYMLLNQIKEEKALVLSNIDLDYLKNL